MTVPAIIFPPVRVNLTVPSVFPQRLGLARCHPLSVISKVVPVEMSRKQTKLISSAPVGCPHAKLLALTPKTTKSPRFNNVPPPGEQETSSPLLHSFP